MLRKKTSCFFFLNVLFFFAFSVFFFVLALVGFWLLNTAIFFPPKLLPINFASLGSPFCIKLSTCGYVHQTLGDLWGRRAICGDVG